MNISIFPKIVETTKQPGIASYEKKCFFHEKLLYHYLMRKIEGWSVKDFLETEKIEKYVLYAVTDFTILFMKDLRRNNGRRPTIICDKNTKKFCGEALGSMVLSPEQMVHMYKEGEVQRIIVMSVLHENEIIEELLKRDILLNDIISFVSVLYS